MSDKEVNILEHRNQILTAIGNALVEKVGYEKLDAEIYRISDAVLEFLKTLDTGGNAFVPLALDLTVLRYLKDMTEVVPKSNGKVV